MFIYIHIYTNIEYSKCSEVWKLPVIDNISYDRDLVVVDMWIVRSSL